MVKYMEEFIEIPGKVSADIEDRRIAIKGPKGEITKDFDDPRFNRIIKIEKVGEKIVLRTEDDHRKIKAMVGTIAAHINNMITGVTKGYSYTMKIVTTHFPITVTASGSDIQIKNFFGEKSSRHAKIVGQANVKIDKEQIEVLGIDIESVGQTAANIERACKVRGRDRRIFQDGIYIYSKALQTGEAI